MFPLLSISIVVFIFSLSQTTRTQDGHLPRPSIFAVPGHAHALPRGISVVIACRSPVGFERFRLEKEHLRIIDVINSSSSKTAARFYLGTVSKDTAGHYSCLYNIRNSWSPRSETLELKVIREDITEASPPVSDMTSEPVEDLVICDFWCGLFPLSMSHGPRMALEPNWIIL
ncbi:leukocyte-associated immunoglobulin-like receptor 2 isoform X2 [Mesocricetus auratus]|uniref:Leukocyte-associated immunoglobulin-like receptor 2 isoform X2 n=1 Tax=Mesocricetus auratus TaxID=10036 RepID=A0A3Q0DEZ9_MESAU|nr:leukocyte-associated immunoglobulin-like receptor 2 isoform X2 [Mesocricetus auratus]